MTKTYTKTKIVDVDNSDKMTIQICYLHPEYYAHPNATFYSIVSSWMEGLFYCVMETPNNEFHCYCTDHLLTDQPCFHISHAKAKKQQIIMDLFTAFSIFMQKMRSYVYEAYYSIKINDYLSIKLKRNAIRIYVQKKEFSQCRKLLFINPHLHPQQDQIDSIDEAVEVLGHSSAYSYKITLEEEFWGHASNVQTWAENNYDTRLLHSNLSFPLLKKLAEAGDPNAKKVFKDEIVKRFDSGFLPVAIFLANGRYLDLFTQKEEIEVLERIAREKYHCTLREFREHKVHYVDLDDDFDDDLDLEEELEFP